MLVLKTLSILREENQIDFRLFSDFVPRDNEVTLIIFYKTWARIPQDHTILRLSTNI